MNNIKNIELVKESYSLDKITQINIKSYNLNNVYNSKQTGIFPQDVENILPELIYFRDDWNDTNKYVKYDNLIPHLVNCIKELNNKINSLTNELQEIKNNN